MNTIDAIMTRRSVRSYTSEPVTKEQIDILLKAAMQAPTTINNRDWAFIVVDDREVMNKIIANQEGNADMLAQAPVAIVVCGDLDLAIKPDVEYWVQDCSAATENILLAAHDMGLGAVWLGTYPVMNRVEGMKKIFNLPENIVPMAVVSIGHPARQLPKADRYEPKKIHYNKW